MAARLWCDFMIIRSFIVSYRFHPHLLAFCIVYGLAPVAIDPIQEHNSTRLDKSFNIQEQSRQKCHSFRNTSIRMTVI